MGRRQSPSKTRWPDEGRRRVQIDRIRPDVDGGRFPIKRVVGEQVNVLVDAFTDGHDRMTGVVRYRHDEDTDWQETPLLPDSNDRWRASFRVTRTGRYRYTVDAWIDEFATWCHDLSRRPPDDPDLPLAFAIGAESLAKAAARTDGESARRLSAAAQFLVSEAVEREKRTTGLDADLARLVSQFSERRFVSESTAERIVVVDRDRARHGAWYEFFPRSCGGNGHGSFERCDAMLAYVASMGFDVVYLPPIHPIGMTFRKGKNNSPAAEPGDVGSPWAIGSADGGHTAIHRELGSLDDFRNFINAATRYQVDVALDLAFQCSPDHPYVKEHPEWFRKRSDGTIQYAENPPKKYQDIYPFDFETADWRELWSELNRVVRFWIDQGVRIFRVDNPHTKSFDFWEWLIDDIKRDWPDVIFLSEAFTRPKVMHRLAKLGFSQSYTYFTWRNTKHELVDYFTELHQSDGREYLRPSIWPNTPDILHEYLQFGGRPAFAVRLVLAATLAANYGIYGPAFELSENQPRDAGSEEYRDSEKYQLRQWDLGRADSLRDVVRRVNAIRRDNPALQQDWNLRFHDIDNDKLIAYSKVSDDHADIVVVVVNLDPHHRQSGWLSLPLDFLGVQADRPYQVHDLLADTRYLWDGPRNYVELDPAVTPAHIFRVRRRVHRENDFDYYL